MSLLPFKDKEGQHVKKLANYLACLGVFAIVGPLAVAQKPPTPQQTQDANVKAYINMMRQDLKKDKVAILTELMELGPEQSAKYGASLPADLNAEAKNSKFYTQYCPGMNLWLCRPQAMPGSDLTYAFEPN